MPDDFPTRARRQDVRWHEGGGPALAGWRSGSCGWRIVGFWAGQRLGNGWGIAVGLLGLLAGAGATMGSIFAATMRESHQKSHFNGLTLAGLLSSLMGLALWWHLGGLIETGAGVAALGVGIFLAGVGLLPD